MPFEIIRDDIARSAMEAIVCPSGEDMVPAGGVSHAIFSAAGPRLLREVRKVGRCPTGGAVLTRGHELPAKYIIHTAGPIWKGGSSGEEEALRSCYRSCLTLAEQEGIPSVAFPLIAAGTFGYPKSRAIRVATEEIGAFLLEHEDIHVQLVIFDMEAYRAGSSMFKKISSFVDEGYVASRAQAHSRERLAEAMAEAGVTETPLLRSEPVVVRPQLVGERAAICPGCMSPIRPGMRFCGRCGQKLEESLREYRPDPAPTLAHREDATVLYQAAPKKEAKKLWPQMPVAAPAPAPIKAKAPAARTLESRLQHLSDPFSTYLLHLIDLSGKTDAEVYKKANIDRKLFSKIRSNPSYQPKKTTALALAVALELNIDDTADLLQRAGYALSPANKFDLIISWFIENGNYNIFEINEALFCFEQQLLGA